MRDRLRNRVTGDIRTAIKRVALGQLKAGGPAAISVNAIGRELGVSGPALYRYYPSRDDLVTDLILDAYAELTAAVAPASVGPDPLLAFARAYRDWARAQPHRYRLLFAPPLPSYDPHAEALVLAAQRLMDLLTAALAAQPSPELVGEWPAGLEPREFRRWAERRGADARQALRGVVVWSRLHGLVALEIDGNFGSIGVDPTGLYAAELRSVLTDYPPVPVTRSRNS